MKNVEIAEEGILVYDQAGHLRAIVQPKPNEAPVILLFHRDGKPAGGLALPPSGELVATFCDDSSRVRLAVKLGDDGEAVACRVDQAGHIVLLSARRLDDPPAAVNLAASVN